KEALTNALKHALAKEVHMQAKVSAHWLEICIQDDGTGFVAAKPKAEGKQHGLENMQRRAEEMGGKLTWECAPGKGTAIRLAVPLPDAPRPD
ncbi:MAG TPA: ATP-binding protein, partial [Candidatus Saccharimonadales bacterium]|nr:ATP-binding protein [Candidatus Saccharimonadales bacterium]